MAALGCVSLLVTLAGCGRNEKQKAELAEQKRIECLDKFCPGDVEPSHDLATEVALKLNGQWFIGPSEYFSAPSSAASFDWWDHKPLSIGMAQPPEMHALMKDGSRYDFLIEIFLRSNNIPSEPRGYQLIELAASEGWIESRITLRPGLDAIKMKHVIGPRGQYIDHVTYYIATQLNGLDGLPPVAGCSHTSQSDSGGTGFMWQSGIWVGMRMNQKHCADWPEIYQEMTRVLQLLKKA